MNIETITSRANPKIKEAASFKDGKGAYFLVEGFHEVSMALHFGLAVSVFSLKPYPCAAKQYIVNESVLAKLTNTRSPEGIVALCKKKEEKPLLSPRVMILDGVQDPGNLGTILRGSLAFGFRDVILGEKCASAYSDKALMASQGAIFGLNIVKSGSLVSMIESLKNADYTLIGTSLKNALPLSELKKQKFDKIAIIVGNEGKGVREEILRLTHQNVRIEMEGIDSLNVAMAASIIMYEYRNVTK